VSPVDPAELRAAVDDVAIRGLIAAYADVVNRRAWGELHELFLSDAPLHLDLRDRELMQHVGPAAVGAFIDGAIERFAFFEFVALNVRVLRDADPDRARVRTYMCELRQDHAGTPSRAFGLYQDDVLRTTAGWRFARRNYQSMGRGEQRLDLMPPPRIF
jgi:hypothetical protein